MKPFETHQWTTTDGHTPEGMCARCGMDMQDDEAVAVVCRHYAPPLHEKLLALMVRRPLDYTPWGDLERWKDPEGSYPDCSSGCRYALWLADTKTESLGADWCVCSNPKSHRAGLLTFEHQGCQAFELAEDDEDEL